MISDWKKHIYWKLVRRVSYMTSSNSGINLIIEIFKAPVKWHGFFWNKGHLHTKTYKCLYLVCAKNEQAMKSMIADQNQCTSFTNGCNMFEFNAISCNYIGFFFISMLYEFKMSNLKVFLIVSSLFFYIMMYTLMKLLNTLLCQTKHFVYLL